MRTMLIISLWFLAITTFSSPASAQCQDMFQARIDWSRHSVDGRDLDDREVGFKLTSNRADGKYVSYTEGSLKLQRDNRRNVVGFYDPGEARQLFSDRKYSYQNLTRCTYLQTNRNVPFSILSPDALRVEVLKNPADNGATLIVNTTLLSWGNGHETFVGQCRNNLIFGFNDSTQTLFTLSLFNH
jgi:hypothetical protein